MWLGKGREVVKPWAGIEKEPWRSISLFLPAWPQATQRDCWKTWRLRRCTYVYRTFIGQYGGEKICVLNPYFGAPASVFALELAIKGGRRYL